MSHGPIIDFTEQDLLSTKLVSPAWYRVKIGTFAQGPSKAGDSVNYTFENTTILRNADTGSEEFAGVPVRLLFSAKPAAKPFMIGFFAALQGKEIEKGQRFGIADAEGKEIEQFIGNKQLEDGRVVNDPTHRYRTAQ